MRGSWPNSRNGLSRHVFIEPGARAGIRLRLDRPLPRAIGTGDSANWTLQRLRGRSGLAGAPAVSTPIRAVGLAVGERKH
jgi:hypothetical protein